MRIPWILIATGVALLAGCGQAERAQNHLKQVAMETPPVESAPIAGALAGGENEVLAWADAGEKERPAEAPQADKPPALPRKIITNADLRIIVKDLAAAEGRLDELVGRHKAYVAMGETSGTAGAPRRGQWRLRVPVDELDGLLRGLLELGVPERNRRDSQDVSEEYYDLADRIKNKKLEQETLRGYLQDRKTSSKLEEILAVEKELARVRGELDQMEGRLRRLRDLTALATVTVTLEEIKDYVPPQAPGFAATLQMTFVNSVEMLGRFGRGIVIGLVALLPWLPVLAVLVLALWMARQRRGRGRPLAGTARPPDQESEPSP